MIMIFPILLLIYCHYNTNIFFWEGKLGIFIFLGGGEAGRLFFLGGGGFYPSNTLHRTLVCDGDKKGI